MALIYALIELWPTSAGPEEGGGTSQITVLGWSIALESEAQLFVIVALAGALGSMIHSFRSFAWYVGNRELRWSWLGYYAMLPFGGASLGVIFFLVFRAGFFTPETSVEEVSPFGFAAVAALIGMFSDQAVTKLREVTETLLASPPTRKDSIPSQDESG